MNHREGVPTKLFHISVSSFLIFYLFKLSDMAEEKTPDQKETVEEIRQPVARPRWVIPLIFVVTIVFLLWYFSRSCGETKPTTGESPDTTAFVIHQHFIASVNERPSQLLR